jgi:hypothetical protein
VGFGASHIDGNDSRPEGVIDSQSLTLQSTERPYVYDPDSTTFSLFLNFMVIDYPVPTSRSLGKGIAFHGTLFLNS